MHIEKVEVKNFRCVQSHVIEFDQITSFIGPNGAGKSTVLRALNWVFNGAKDSLDFTDIFGAIPESTEVVSVTVTFGGLTDRDRIVLTPRYAPTQSSSFTLRREWSISGEDRLSGGSEGYPPFSDLKRIIDGPADPAKAMYLVVRDEISAAGSELPIAKTKPAIKKALEDWELANLNKLAPTFSTDTQIFGFAGQGELAKIFTFIFVDADLRASEEVEDSSKTIVGRLMSRALDRTVAVQAYSDLAVEVATKHDLINATHLGPLLAEISQKLSDGIGRFTVGRSIDLRPQGSQYTPAKAKVEVHVIDGALDTGLANQGHGFQRATLVACLQVLADYSANLDAQPALFLAIEEPELFQHPNQARAFAAVLRRLASDERGKLQIAYATHSPYFVDPAEFQQVRRVTRGVNGCFSATATSRDAIAECLEGVQSPTWDINSQWSRVILGDLREALFASVVVLCEGADDAAIIAGASRHFDDFDVHGITATSAPGKAALFLPHAVLQALGIPVLVVFDNDS